MSYINFKLFAEVVMIEELEKHRRGEIVTGFSNQHDAYILETALEELSKDSKKVTETYEKISEFFDKGKRDYTPMTLASFFASPLVDELAEGFSNAWVD